MEFWRYRSQADGQTPRAHRPVSAQMFAQVSGPPDSRDAFEKGIREGRLAERRRRHGHPLLKLVVSVAAAAGAVVLALALHEGSFSKGGEVIDQKLAVAADNAHVSAADAASKAGRSVKHVGEALGKTVSGAATPH